MLGWIRQTIGILVPAASLVVFLASCDRNVAPFDPDEEPRQPNLGKIFPEGAKRAAAPRQVPPDLAGAQGAPPAAPGPAGDPISGTIDLADGLSAPAGSVLFIIARRGDAGPPLAVKRVMGATFPHEFVLGPDDRMIQAMPFEGPFNLTARIDRDGNAMSRNPGDLQGALSAPVGPGDRGLDLMIDQRL
jgi:hypothetical protein